MAKPFMNPILDRGADPWMYKHTDGKYYFMITLGDRLELWASATLTDVKLAEKKTIWYPPSVGPGAKNIWAPEIHNIHGTWYIYFTASDGTGDKGRRIYVLENQSKDPMQGSWTEKGPVNTRYPGLDGTVFEQNGTLYFLYAGYGNFPEYGSAVYIAAMLNPWTLTGENVLLTKPEYDWEKQGGMAINEGPAILKRKDRIFMIYSASTTWSEDYSLGMLSAPKDSNLLCAGSWEKSPVPVFKKSVENNVFAPGHNSFVKSPDDSEDWIVYHAIGERAEPRLDAALRNTRVQRFSWKSDGTPDFGVPVAEGQSLQLPSGE